MEIFWHLLSNIGLGTLCLGMAALFIEHAFKMRLRSPIALLLNIVHGVAKALDSISKFDVGSLKNESDIASLRTAEAYFYLKEQQALENYQIIAEIDNDDNIPSVATHRAESIQPRKSVWDKLGDSISPYAEKTIEFLVVVGGIVLVGTIGIAALTYAVLHGLEILQTMFKIAAYFVGPLAVMVFVLLLLEKFLPPSRNFAMAQGSIEWLLLDLKESPQILANRRKEVQVILQQIDDGATSLPTSTIDPDLESSKTSSVPLVPGLTELALSRDSESLAEIRRQLGMVGKFHWRLAVASSFTFFGTLALSLYASIFMDNKTYTLAFGSIGLGAVLGTFTFLTLRNVRIANIAITMFETYLLELSANLEFANSSLDEAERRKLRSQAWLDFRKGLNALWKLENAYKGGLSARTKRET